MELLRTYQHQAGRDRKQRLYKILNEAGHLRKNSLVYHGTHFGYCFPAILGLSRHRSGLQSIERGVHLCSLGQSTHLI